MIPVSQASSNAERRRKRVTQTIAETDDLYGTPAYTEEEMVADFRAIRSLVQQNAGRDAGLGKSADLSGFKEYIVRGYNRCVCRLYTLADNRF